MSLVYELCLLLYATHSYIGIGKIGSQLVIQDIQKENEFNQTQSQKQLLLR